jgi:predicted transcriptional regulator
MSAITPSQIRAARGMLDWSMVNLASAARVSVSTVKRIEDGLSDPMTERTIALMQDALETEGVRFLTDDGNGPGVRFRRR